jgi:glycosyltransferase involved in cell wall biosynthesis
LLYLGRIAPWKAPDVAVRAVAELRAEGIDATLTMAGGAHFGEKAYARGLQQLAEAEAGVSVLGHIDDVASLLRDHDVLVHCSTAPEPFGQVIVQGLASGMPVVATNHGGPVEILQEAPTNLLYQPGDPSALARAVEAAVDNYEVLRTWGQMRSASFRDDILRDQLDRTLIALTV